MRCMVVKTQVMVYDRVVRMVRFDQVFERSRALLSSGFDIVNLDGGKVD